MDGKFRCCGNCDDCTLECATAELPSDESDFEFEDDDLEQKYWGCSCVSTATPSVVLLSDAGLKVSQSDKIGINSAENG